MTWGDALGGAGDKASEKPAAGLGIGKFKKAANALNKFKTAVHAVTAMRKFRRGPLNTILTIPQEQAMQKMISSRQDENEKEIRTVKHSSCGRVANLLGADQKQKSEARQESLQQAEMMKKMQQEMFQNLGDTFNHLVVH